jgi:hypothetical protein
VISIAGEPGIEGTSLQRGPREITRPDVIPVLVAHFPAAYTSRTKLAMFVELLQRFSLMETMRTQIGLHGTQNSANT